jgi:aryl-alcohol dehydrogenase-like predicted oxidoreductase
MPVDRRDFIKGVAAGAVGAGLVGMTAGDVFAEKEGKEAADKKKKETVKTRKLGRTKLDVGVVAVGCGPIRPGLEKILSAAADRGINLFDTAWSYGRGQSQVAVGNFLKGRKDREKLFILTKSSGFRPKSTTKETYEDLKKRVQACLKDLQTDYIDIFMSPHGASTPAAVRNKFLQEALTKLKEDDKLIKWIGTSSHSNYAATCEAAIKDGFYDCLMPVVNIGTQNVKNVKLPERGRRGRPPMKPADTKKMLKLAKEKNVGIIVMKAAQRGFIPANVDDLLKGEFKKDSKLSLHQKLYSYVLKQEGVSCVTVGMNDVKFLKEAYDIGLTV